MLKQFYFKQFSLAWVRNFNVQKILFQAIQLSAQFISIWSIDTSLSGTTTPCQSGPGSDRNEGLIRMPKVPALLEPHH